MGEISFSDNNIDSGDIHTWVEDFENEYQDDDFNFLEDEAKNDPQYDNYLMWKEAADELQDDMQLISREVWVEYCVRLCSDVGDIPRDLPRYIRDHIDWKGVADEIEQDYDTIIINGYEFLWRE